MAAAVAGTGRDLARSSAMKWAASSAACSTSSSGSSVGSPVEDRNNFVENCSLFFQMQPGVKLVTG